MEFMNEQVLGQVIMASKDITEALQSIDNSTKEITFSFLNSTRQPIKQQQSRQRQSIAPSQDGGGTHGGRQIRGASSISLSTAEEEEEEEDDDRHSTHGLNRADGNERIQMMRIRAEGISGSTEVNSTGSFSYLALIVTNFSLCFNSSTSLTKTKSLNNSSARMTHQHHTNSVTFNDVSKRCRHH